MTDVRPLASGDPARVGDYELLGRVGEGAQGTVYLARDPGGAQVAVKLLKAHFDADTAARDRFVQELANAKRVARFCTAQVIAADLAGDRPYIVSEYVRGRSLAQAVNADGPLSDGALERLAIGTATALVAIHKANIVHRDFKPHNVLLGPDGPRVIDFGIAKALDATSTVSSAVVGTPAYMAPEQVAGAALGPAVDIFAWASTMVFAATGMPPFGHDSIPAVIGRLLHGSPELGAFGGPVRELVEAALARDAAQRPTAQQLLLRLLGQDVAAAPVSTTPPELLEEAATMAGAFPPVAQSGPAAAFGMPPAGPSSTVPPTATMPPATDSMAATMPSPGGVGAPAASTRPGAYGPYPNGPVEQPVRPRKRGSGLTVVATSVAVAVILLLGGGVGYAILTSGHSSSHGTSGSGTATGSPAGDSSSLSSSASASTSQTDSSPSSGGTATTVTVPSVAGQNKSYAISQLQAKGLHYSVHEQYSGSYDSGTVISSDPSGGSTVDAGSSVTLYVSKGPKPSPTCTVPNIVGMSDSDASSALSRAGLHGSSSGGTGTDDKVASQDPAAGSPCHAGDTITYTLIGSTPTPSPTAS